MAKYRKIALVEAEQFLPAEGKFPSGVYSSGHGDPRKNPNLDWVLNTLEGRHILRGGDYICTGPTGERWNVAREIFEATYELVDVAPSAALTAPAHDLDALREDLFDVIADAAGYDPIDLRHKSSKATRELHAYIDGITKAVLALPAIRNVLATPDT